MNKINQKYFSFSVIISLMFLLSSCGMWTNFTAYYNRYYKAEKAFEDGEAEIKLGPKKPLFQFKENKLPSKANKNFDDVIKFASMILQFNKDSKYVNEAIFIIAESYYYKGQYNKALRKFKELDGLNDEDLGLTTKLMIAKSELQMRNFLVALEQLNEIKILAVESDDEEILFGAFVAEISYYIYREDYPQSILKIEELLKQDLEDEVLAEVTFELGMLYVTLENYEKAVGAFELVEEGSPTFEIEFNTKLEYAKTIKYLEREEEALEILGDLRDDSKYEPYWDLVDLEIAQIHLEKGETDLALELFYSVDTAYSKNESSGIAAFMQGDILEHIYMDFDSAKILYDKVASKKAPAEYKAEAKYKANLLKSRKDYSDKIFISKLESRYLLDTALFVQDSIAYAAYLVRRDSAQQVEIALQEASGEIRAENRRGRTRGTAIAQRQQFKYWEDSLFTYEPKLPIMSLDSMNNYIVKNEYELANLYFTDLIVPDSAYYYYNEILTLYPNTRYQARTLYALGSYYSTVDDKAKADSLFQIVYDNYKSDPIAKAAAIRLGISTDELDSDPVLKKYLVAEKYMEEEEYFDAIEELNDLYKTNPESQYAPKALYSIGWIYENEFEDYDGAIEFYDSLKAKYPKTEYVREINPKVIFYHQKMKAIQDSIALVEKAIADSLRADSLAQFNLNALTDSTSIRDSSLVTDSTSIVDSSSIADSNTVNLIDSTKKVLENNLDQNNELKKESEDEVYTDSTKAYNPFKK